MYPLRRRSAYSRFQSDLQFQLFVNSTDICFGRFAVDFPIVIRKSVCLTHQLSCQPSNRAAIKQDVHCGWLAIFRLHGVQARETAMHSYSAVSIE